MSEWERMLEGKMYNDFSDELFVKRVTAKKIFKEYNKTNDNDVTLRNKLLKDLFENIGERVWIEPDFRCEFGKNITIENDVYINFGCIILDCNKVVIGEHTLIGPNCGLYAANHAIDKEERINGGCIGKPIHIGKNVWLGGDVKVLGGVTIGDNTIIGTGSIVTKDIPSNCIAVGSPCKVLRYISDLDKTDYLEYLNK